jgi:alpha-glucuronidase
MLKRLAFSLSFGLAVLAGATACGQTADQGWLKYPSSIDRSILPLQVRSLGRAPLELSATQELKRSTWFTDLPTPQLRDSSLVLGTSSEVNDSFPQLSIPNKLGPDGYWLTHVMVRDKPTIVVAGADERGVLYGAFALLRRLRQGQLIYPLDLSEQPAMPVRWVDEWDNADGSIERGYAGRSIFFEDGKVREDLAPVGEYARLLASVGINGCNVNNVNGSSPFLTSDRLRGLGRAASTMRPWGVRLALSVDIASPRRSVGWRPTIRSIRQ